MSETRKPQWVRCGECSHEWIGLYMPIEVNRLSKIVKGMHCPSCAADRKAIYFIVTAKQKAETGDMTSGREKFGAFIRREREAREIGLREMAKKIGVSPTYMSKVERDEFTPPTEDKVRSIAQIFECDPDELLAMAGRVPSDIAYIIKRHPVEMSALLRTANGLSAEDLARLSREAGKAKCIFPEEGDPWYEYTFRGEAGPGLYSITNMTRRIEELIAENKMLRDAVYIDDLTVTMQASDRSKAIEGIGRALDLLNADMVAEAKAGLRTTLAEIKGKSHE